MPVLRQLLATGLFAMRPVLHSGGITLLVAISRKPVIFLTASPIDQIKSRTFFFFVIPHIVSIRDSSLLGGLFGFIIDIVDSDVPFPQNSFCGRSRSSILEDAQSHVPMYRKFRGPLRVFGDCVRPARRNFGDFPIPPNGIYT